VGVDLFTAVGQSLSQNPGAMSPPFPPSSSDGLTRLAISIGAGGVVWLLGWLLHQLLPWLLLLGLIGVGLWLWQRHRQQQQYLHTVFYDYLQASQGEVSALEFAMAAHVTGQQARAFLDARARDFWADFEPTPQGDVLYRFPMRSPAPHHRPADPK
jgi:hypothetical protein